MDEGRSAQERAEQLRRDADEARRRAASLERAAGAWQAGADGERRVAKQLAALGGEAVVLHDRLLQPGESAVNLDHVVVLRSGVYLVDAKNWAGSVQVCDGDLWQHVTRDGVVRHLPKHRELAAINHAAAEMEQRLGEPVTPVLALAGGAEGSFVPVRVHGVQVLRAGDLLDWLRSKDATPHAVGDVPALARRVDIAFPPAGSSARPLAVAAAPRAKGRPVSPAARRRGRVPRRRPPLLLRLVATGLFVALLYGVTQSVPGILQEAVGRTPLSLPGGSATASGTSAPAVRAASGCAAVTDADVRRIFGARWFARAHLPDGVCLWDPQPQTSRYAPGRLRMTYGEAAKPDLWGKTARVEVGQGSAELVVLRGTAPAELGVSGPAAEQFVVQLGYDYPRSATATQILDEDARARARILALGQLLVASRT